MSLQIMPVTEDTPPDMLAGAMDLNVILPNGSVMKMSVERSTPMIDLLVQITTAHKLSPGSHAIHAIGDLGVLPYKPSTPIGTLDTWTVNVVPKNISKNGRYQSAVKCVPKPFEQTFRLQVHLPRNQLYVARISPKTQLSSILKQVCSEKNLDPAKYTLRKPDKPNEPLDLNKTLVEYKLQQLALVLNANRALIGGLSSDDIMSRTPKKFSCDDSLSSGSLGERSLSPTRSDGSSDTPRSRSLMVKVLPSRPVRKRRLAPKPPSQHRYSVPEQTMISHSRNSSDSSGYHESSVLSDAVDCNSRQYPMGKASGPSLSRSMTNLQACGQNQNQFSVTPFTSNGISQSKHSASTTSLVSIQGRKKKAAPPPPPSAAVKPKLEPPPEEPEDREPEVHRKSQTLPANGGACKSKTASRIELNNNVVEPPDLSPATSSLSSLSRSDVDRDVVFAEPSSPVSSVSVDCSRQAPLAKNAPRTKRPAPRPPARSSSIGRQSEPQSASASPLRLPSGCSTGDEDELRMDDEEIDRIFGDATDGYDSPSGTPAAKDDIEWEYKLPDPPTAFRDHQRRSPTVTAFDTVTIGALSTDGTIGDASATAVTVVEEEEVKEEAIRPESGLEKTVVVVDEYVHSCFLQDSGVGSDDSSLPSSCEEKLTAHADEKLSSAKIAEPATNDASAAKKKLNNFKIVAYDDDCCGSRPTEIFCDDSVKTWKTTQKAREANPAYNATAAGKTSTVSRRNSFNSTGVRPPLVSAAGPVTVKRSTSHISLLSGNIKPWNRLAKHHYIGRTYSTEPLDYDDRPLARRSYSVDDITEDARESSTDEQTPKTVNEPTLEQTSPLHSLQVLRTILPQLQEHQPKEYEQKTTSSNFRLADDKSTAVILDDDDDFRSSWKFNANNQKREEEMVVEQTKETTSPFVTPAVDNVIASHVQKTEVTDVENRLRPATSTVTRDAETRNKPDSGKFAYAGPPKISLSTWNERPKRQVSIKTDRDYVIGGLRQRFQQNENDGQRPWVAFKGQADKKPMAAVSPSTAAVPDSSVSRVPVVKSVELKKPYAEQLQIPPALALSEVIKAQAKLSNGYGGGVGCQQNRSSEDRVKPCPAAPTFGELKSSRNCVRPVLKKPQPSFGIKGCPEQEDPRQNLLEAIKAFGGRDNLRKIRA
ncbi:uncharacterized protein LOC126843812 isoform X2 [Adelges cooleyi]|nr:uncharacterized protein LOC126843812 isoform X2 [Adelges cooleyi]